MGTGFSTWGKAIFMAGLLLLGGQGALHAAKVNVKLTADGKGKISAPAYTAKGNQIALSLAFAPSTGQTLTVVRNRGLGFISGKFKNLAQGQAVQLAYNGYEYPFIADYYGGTGNDLVLHWGYRDLYAWGYNEYGQGGNEELTGNGSEVPVEVTKTGILAGKKVLRIASGGRHSIALCSDGTLAAWGENTHGQLGDGSVDHRYAPVRVLFEGALAGKYPVAVTAGMGHSVVLCEDGSVVAWGRNDLGQLGNGNFTDSRTPVAVTGKALAGAPVVAVSAGNAFTVALRSDGQAVAWGDNTEGTLGNGRNRNSPTPVKVDRKGVLAKRSVVSVVAGGEHVLAVCSDGVLISWGNGTQGQLGNNARTSSNVPVRVSVSGILKKKKPVSVTAGTYHSLVVCSDGTAAAWGANESGQLGDSTATGRIYPVAISADASLPGKKVKLLAAGGFQSFALRDDRVPLAWGNNIYGQLGIGNFENKAVPVVIPLMGPLLENRLVAIAAGWQHAVGIAASPLSGDTGLNALTLDKGAMNLDFSTGRSDYVAGVPTGGNMTVVVSPSTRHPLARVTVNGVAHVPGTPGVPVKFGIADMMIVVRVTAENGTSSDYRINLRPSGNQQFQFFSASDIGLTREAFTAANLHANLGLQFEPVPGTNLMVVDNTGLNPIKGRFLEFSHGDTVVLDRGLRQYHFIANYQGGDGNDLVLEWKRRTIAAWGANSQGQLGNDTQAQSSVPVAVKDSGTLAGKVVLRVFSGGTHTVALCSDGTLAAWGANSQGQLGDGTTTMRTSPVAVDISGILNGKTVISVDVASGRTRVLCSDGTLAAWGEGVSTPAEIVPAGALIGRKVVAFSANGSNSLALCSDGAMLENPFGSALPVDQSGVLAGKVVNRITCGTSHYLGLCSDGTLVAWGYNESGQLGTGGDSGPFPPTLVDRTGILADKTVVSISAIASRNFAVCSDGTLAAWGSGALGNTGNQPSSIPVPVANTGPGSGKSVISVSRGTGHTLAACSDGTLLGWGTNTSGQLGDGTTTNRPLPVAVSRPGFLSGTQALEASTGTSFTAALFAIPADSTLSSLAVADGSISPSFSPAHTDYSLSFPALTQALTITPTVRYPWSRITIDGTEVASGAASSPIVIAGRQFVDVVVTGEHLGKTTYKLRMPGNVQASFATAADVPVVSTGYVATGWTVGMDLQFAPQVGTALTVVRNTGIGFINGEFSNLTQGQEVWLAHNGIDYHFIANYYGGNGNDLVLEWADRKVSAWGLNSSGQFGNDSKTGAAEPVAVDETGILSGKTVVSLSGGATQSVALCVDGTVASWGGGGSGQLGGGVGVTESLVPLDLTGTGALSGKRVVAVATANMNSLALCSDGTMASWGYGNAGQLGNGSNANSFVPVPVDHSGVLSGKSVVAVTMGGTHCLALCSDGTMVTWGANNLGQLGNNSSSTSLVPVEVNRAGVLAGRSVVAITAGLQHCAALCSDGTLVAWGDNSSGQLGSPSVPNPKVPVVVAKTGELASKTVVSLSQGANDFVLGLCSDGSMLAWGGNSNGQLGNGSPAYDSFQPVAVNHSGVLAGKSVISVGSGYKVNVAACSDGTVVTWGYNPYGQLGNGGTADSRVPVLVSADGILAGHKGLNVAGAFHGLLVSAVDAPAGITLAVAARQIEASAAAPFIPPAIVPASTTLRDQSSTEVTQVEEVRLAMNDAMVVPAFPGHFSPFENVVVFEYRRNAAAGADIPEVFEYGTDTILWEEVEVSPSPDPRVTLGLTNDRGEQSVRIRIPVPTGVRMFGRLKVRQP